MASGLNFLCGDNMTVYVDVLISINIFVNYFLLLLVKSILKLNVKRYRIFLGAFAGGLYSLVIFMPETPNILTLLMNLTASLSIVLISFKPKNLKLLLKAYIAFFCANFAFAGLMLALWIFFKPKSMIYNNSVVYFDIDIKILVISTVVCYCALKLIFTLIKRSSPDNKIYSITLFNKNKSVTVNALLDTGNTLRDCFTGKPVIVAEKGVIKKLFDSSVLEFFDTGQIPNTYEKSKLRLIPVNTVSNEGVLRSAVIDGITINSKNLTVNNILLAQSKTSFSNGEYSVLLNNDIFDERGKNDAKNLFKIGN